MKKKNQKIYLESKNNLLRNVNNFILSDDLCKLADAKLLVDNILNNEEFPLQEYYKLCLKIKNEKK